jgi:conjugal transfer pilus assembly protein TraB
MKFFGGEKEDQEVVNGEVKGIDEDNNTNSSKQKKIQLVFFIIAVCFIILIKFLFSDKDKPKEEKVSIEQSLFNEDENFKASYLGKVAPDITNAEKKADMSIKENKKLEKRIQELEKKLNYLSSSDQQSDTNKETNVKDNKHNSYKTFPMPYKDKSNMDTSKTNDTTSNTYQYNPTPVIHEVVTNSIRYKKVDLKKKPVISNKKEYEPFYLPTGTVIRAKLLSGFNAPTLSNAKSNPLPVLLKVTDLAMLPNGFSSNIKECNIMGEAYGYLSTERARIRTNNISCITKDGKYIDTDIKGYVSGEDGKLGLKGRAVSKQGALLGRAFIASFLEGISKIFSSQSQTVITSGLGTTSTNSSNNVKERMESAVFGGLGETSKTASDFYKDMLQNIEPTIEVSANRTADIILTAGKELKTLKFKDNK